MNSLVKSLRALFLVLTFAFGTFLLCEGVARGEVKVWEGTLTLPTYVEGLPDINPPFDLFRQRSFITYPYTTRENLTDQKISKAWRTLNLENEYLKVVVLPDLGGRLYSCIDKATGNEMFYANPSIKYAQVAFRGAWVALGIEFNFPVSHNWMTVSPVDFRTVRNSDGSASIWVGNIDRPYGMLWRVSLTLRPGSSLLEQTVTLYNRDALRHRFYWWNTSSVEAWDDTRIIYPMELTAAHGYADIDTWPVDMAGYDLSLPKNHTRGFVSRFAVGSREPFMGAYHPKTNAGMVHYAEVEEAPGKKIWSWGWDADGRDWRQALSDNDSAYLEIQAGLFRNQETYAFLEPQQFIRFHEYYMPVRGIGGFSRANLSGVIHLQRQKTAGNKLSVGINVNQEVAHGRIRISQQGKPVTEEPFSLKPSGLFQKAYSELNSAGPYTVELLDAGGKVLLKHTENQYDLLPKSDFKMGPQEGYQIPPAAQRSEGDFVEEGKNLELLGRLLPAYNCYLLGLQRFPESFELNKAAGRLAVHLKRYSEAEERLARAQVRVNNDPELYYYLGNAWMGLGNSRKAQILWEGALLLPDFRAAALLQLAQLHAREGELDRGLEQLRKALSESPDLIRAGGMEVALLRRLGRTPESRQRLSNWLELDPPNSFLRHEAVKLGAHDEALWGHLAGDPERVLEVAVDYMGLGFYQEAVELLSRQYPADGAVGEPGAVPPQQYPLIAYYRGFCREKLGLSGRSDFEAAAKQSARYVFPNRPQTLEVLGKALENDPSDATAHYLLGCLYLSGGLADSAVQEWEAARKLNPQMPVLHRNLGMALLHAKHAAKQALEIFREGVSVDPQNVDLYLGMDQALSLLDSAPRQRLEALQRYPDQRGMPSQLLHKLALTYLECGQPEAAEKLFSNRTFIREEFGTNIREIFLEVQLQKALMSAQQGRHEVARAIVARMNQAVPGLAFTRDGLEVFIQGARFQYYLGVIESLCGNDPPAREHWQKALQSQDYRQLPFGYLAVRRLGNVDEKAWQKRFSSGLVSARSYLAGGGHFPAVANYGEGVLLRALGQTEEGNRVLRDTFLLPDKRMAHYLSRQALQEVSPGVGAF